MVSAKYEWLKQFLELPNGIPSHDTFSRIFARLNPQQFQQCFLNWIRAINKMTSGEVIAIDGKSLRHSYDKEAFSECYSYGECLGDRKSIGSGAS